MHVIIVGCGRVGSQLALALSSEGHDVVIIDKNPEAFSRLGPDFNGITITGIGFDPEILKRAGVERAQALVAVTNGDNSNIMISQVAKKIFKVPRVVTRLYDPERAQIYKKRFGLETFCSTILNANIFKSVVLNRDSKFEFSIGNLSTAIIEIKNKKGAE